MDKIENVCTLKNVMLEHLYHQPALDAKEIFNTLMEYKEMVLRMYATHPNTLRCDQGRKECPLRGSARFLKGSGSRYLPDGYFFLHTGCIRAIGAGIPPYEIKNITTVVKAYSSAVGAGAFVSEIFGEEADELRRRGGDGGEFGATTGRPRRMDGSMQSHQDMAYRSRDPQRLPSRFSTF